MPCLCDAAGARYIRTVRFQTFSLMELLFSGGAYNTCSCRTRSAMSLAICLEHWIFRWAPLTTLLRVGLQMGDRPPRTRNLKKIGCFLSSLLTRNDYGTPLKVFDSVGAYPSQVDNALTQTSSWVSLQERTQFFPEIFRTSPISTVPQPKPPTSGVLTAQRG